MSSLPNVFPVFPLDEAILVPGALLPLHVFEPRYHKLVADCMSGERCFAMAFPLRESEGGASPALHPVCCLGRIIQHRRLVDGCADIVLRGLGRMRIDEELASGEPYRIVSATHQPDIYPGDGDISRDAHAILEQLAEWTDADREMFKSLDTGQILDVVLLHLDLPLLLKQRILAQAEVVKRLVLIEEILRTQAGRSRDGLEFRDGDARLN